MKSRIKTVFALLVALAAIDSPQAQNTKSSENTRLAQLVEANIIAVHAFQVLLAKTSGKGQACFSTGELSDAALNALSEHQAKLLKSDLKQVKLWIDGRESTFDPAANLEPILASGLKITDNAPVNVFTHYLRQNTKASD
ncbi:MAG TPA: hypothetical protein VJ656_08390, partial [Pyrinomonadaceae bacterium]|nr:hypothetical protein [Pyrinomonadaceae bacterium]